ncbi:MAG: TonB-dependent receptor [Ignavibacteriales bacterium]|nr:TonB-dependent receptor [Ignavibacteriales bacterium]
MRKGTLIVIATMLCVAATLTAGQHGKIAGRVTDAENGQPLPGVDVMIEGTTVGTATNVDGYYMILNVPPGQYSLRFSMIGYAKTTIKNVRVEIDITTTIDTKLSATALVTGEIVVTAQRPIVTKDVSASRFNIETKTVEAMPIQTVTEVLVLQAGIKKGDDGIVVRGGGTNQTIFVVDGFIMNDERSNVPYAAVGLSATKELQVQTGGFNAEYGNVRSGVVNVVTKDGDRSRYNGTANVRYKPAAPKHFGLSLYDPNSFFNRPYTDPTVCWTGTKNGAWDLDTQSEYPYFQGWNAVSLATLQDKDPKNDLTPEGAKRLWEWQRRRSGEITKPDYTIDVGFGGPMPVVSEMLGNLRFYLSHFNEREMFIYPLSRDAYTDNHTQVKLTSDITSTMKLTMMGLYGESNSVSPYEWTTAPTGYLMRSQYEVASLLSSSDGMNALYMPDRYSPSSVYRTTFGATLTHMLSPVTFYEVAVQRNQSRYNTFQSATRDTSKVYQPVPGIYVDESPNGYWGYSTGAIDGVMSTGGWMNLGRDKSVNSTTSIRGSITTQFDKYNQVKAGFQWTYDDLDINSGTYSPSMSTWTRSMIYHVFPWRIGVYAQDKLEFQGFIANVGLRLDYSNPNSDAFDLSPYDMLLSQGLGNGIEQNAAKEKAKAEFYISPRLGISHPITENSKLYFNYGHFLSEPSSTFRFRLQRESNGLVTYMGNPNMKLEKTVSYELGFEQNVLDMFLVNLAAYYKDITNQPGWIYYQNINSSVHYYQATNNNYADIRGFEVTLTKIGGSWITGFINYTYDVGSSGYFDLTSYYQDVNQQRAYLQLNPYQSRPHPQPYARANLTLRTPDDFGPSVLGMRPLEGWSVNILAGWTAGSYGTYNPNSIPGVVDNVQWKDNFNSDVRFMKSIRMYDLEFQVYLDIQNVFNIKQLSYAGFVNSYDYQDYLASLCFPWMEGDKSGSDRIGTIRPDDVRYEPLEPNPNNDPAVSARNQVRKDKKSYIDMPNNTSVTFLNPRSYMFGVRVSF